MSFDYFGGVVGGGLIGTASLLLLFFNGKIFGVSGIVGGLFSPTKGDMMWRVALLLGFLVGGVVLGAIDSRFFYDGLNRAYWVLLLAGFLVGFGSALGSGCTSGHGICGVGRLARRSIVATLTFMLTGVFAVLIMKVVLGGGE